MIFDFIVSLGMMGLVLLTQKWAVGADPSDKVNQLRHSDSDCKLIIIDKVWVVGTKLTVIDLIS